MKAPARALLLALAGIGAGYGVGVGAAEPPALVAESHLRETGYVLGDHLEQRVRLPLPAGWRLPDEALPRPGPVTHWMELQSVKRRPGPGDTVELSLRYQVFAAVEQALTLAIPGFPLRLEGADGERRAWVPDQPFTLSPVLPPVLEDDHRALRPGATPAASPIAADGWRAAAALGVALLAAAWLAWHHDRLPGLSRRPGPLTLAHRRLRAALREPAGDHRHHLRLLYQGFSGCAGQTLYRDNLPRLFEVAAHLRPLEAEIRAFFEHTHAAFYARTAPLPWPASRLLELARAAMAQERARLPGRAAA